MYGSSGLILDSDSDTKPIDQFETKEDPMWFPWLQQTKENPISQIDTKEDPMWFPWLQQTKENPISQIDTKESKEPVLPVEFSQWGIKQPGLWDKT